jgi:hypothetical protein
MASPIVRRRSGVIRPITSWSESRSGLSDWRRPKARSCCVRWAPRRGRLERHLGDPAVLRSGEILGEDLGVADHHRQQVVEVVGDPARELAHRLHLLRLAQLLLELHPLRDVADDAEHVGRAPVGVAEQPPARLEPDKVPVLVAEAVGERLMRHLAREELLDPGLGPRRVVRMHELGDGPADQLLGLVAHDVPAGGRDVAPDAVRAVRTIMSVAFSASSR